MAVSVELSSALRVLANGKQTVTAPPGTISEVLLSLDGSYPGLGDLLLDAEGNLRRFLAVFVGEDSIGALEGLNTAVGDGDTVVIMSAVAGG